MTTTVTARLPRSSPHRMRRDLLAAMAGAALFASSAFVVSQISDDNSSHTAVAAAPHAPSMAEVLRDLEYVLPDTAAVQPSTADVSPTPGTAAAQPMRLDVNEAALDACAGGFADACHVTHTWVPVIGLEGMEAAVRDLEYVLR